MSGARILIADDAAFMRQMLADQLRRLGHEVVGEAADGRQAVELFTSLHPDLVLMDIVMPGLDGIEATRAIRRVNPQAVVIFCTAMSQRDHVVKALQAGAADFLVKPFQPDRLGDAIERALGRQRGRTQDS